MVQARPTPNSIEMSSGVYVDVTDPDPDKISVEDIAHALSNVCRYGGHCKRFYSVAEHAVFVSRRVGAMGGDVRAQLAGLHHDDAEAYLGDIPRPIKPLLGQVYADLTSKMNLAIEEALDLDVIETEDHLVKAADNFALFCEARALLPSRGKRWTTQSHAWDLGLQSERIRVPAYFTAGLIPVAAKRAFLARHAELMGILA